MTDQIWNTISEVIPNRLYLTGLKGMENVNNVMKLKIDIIVSITDFIPLKYNKPKQYTNITCVHYYAEDKEDYDIAQYFEKFIILMNDNPNKKILVHCLVGMSRSATIVMAYMLWSYTKSHSFEESFGYTIQNLLDDIKEKREFVDPNTGFINQLNIFRSQLLKFE
jgi:protein tyrosine phosphatase